MHHGSQAEWLSDVSGFLGFYYLMLALMNFGAWFYVWNREHGAFWKGWKGVWLGFTLLFVILAAQANGGVPWPMPEWIKQTVNAASNAVVYTLGTMAVLTVLFLGRRFFVKPIVAWIGLNLSLFLMGWSMTDANFASIVTKADNVPIVALVFLLGFFNWVAARQAVQNDDRRREGREPVEKENSEKVLVWPDLVYIEMICMVAVTVLLLVWAIVLKAPLEPPASLVQTPNPSKAPWYFLGLQEMLVYYDPWMAGVVAPSLIVFGLMAIPFLDFNKKGSGYYTIEERKFSYIVFQLGFLELWVTLIILGTFLRGPNWNFFGPYEAWDPHKVLALNNINLSEIIWVINLGQTLPSAPPGAGALQELGYILLREAVGIILVLAYFLALPPLMAITVFRKFFARMGFLRYMLMTNLLLFMVALPLKMILRWSFNLKYIVFIPEYFLNF